MGTSEVTGHQHLLEVLDAAEAVGRSVLIEPEAKALLLKLGIQVPHGRVARSAEEVAVIVAKLDRPAVLKVVSPDLSHKTDAGGVIGPVSSPEAAGQAYQRVMENVARTRPEARVEGVLVEEFLEGGIECILGFSTATAFGPTVMFGLGGLFVEVLRDVQFRLAPISDADAREMIAELRGARCFDGARGKPVVQKTALVEAIRRLGELARYPAVAARIREIDINPLLATAEGVVALDAFVVLSREDS